jgi:hypothetical protein
MRGKERGDAPQRRPTRTWLAALCVAAILALLLAACLPGMQQDEGSPISGISGWQAPEGFRQDVALNAAGVRTVIYNHSDGNSHIYLMQSPGWLDLSADEILAQAQSTLSFEGEMQFVETQTVDFLGEPTEVLVSEGVNSEGGAYRAALLITEVNELATMILFERPTDSWDAGEMESFFASIE